MMAREAAREWALSRDRPRAVALGARWERERESESAVLWGSMRAERRGPLWERAKVRARATRLAQSWELQLALMTVLRLVR